MWYKNQKTSSKEISQKEAMDKFLPLIEKDGKEYSKITKVKVRSAKEGEVIETFTSDGKETTNKAKKGDYVVTNMTSSEEQYILSESKLKARYKFVEDKDDYKIYQATGKIRALEYSAEKLDMPKDFSFIASWGESTVIKDGDMIATPLPDKNEVYRIAKKEFKETYK